MRSRVLKKTRDLIHRKLLDTDKPLQHQTVDRSQQDAGHRRVLLVFAVYLLKPFLDDRTPALVLLDKAFAETGVFGEGFLDQVDMNLSTAARVHDRVENHTKNPPRRLLPSARLEPAENPTGHVLHVFFGDIENKIAFGRVIVVQRTLTDRRSNRDIREGGVGNSPLPNQSRRNLKNVFPIGRGGLPLAHTRQGTLWMIVPSIFRLATDEQTSYNTFMTDYQSPEQRRLYKSRINRKIAGVCGGLGEFFGIDAVLIRLGLVLLVIIGGTGVLVYIIAALILDDNPYQ